MYLVVIESDDDGTWFNDPEGYNTRVEAQDLARAACQFLPPNHSVVIYSCQVLETYSPNVKANETTPKGSASGNGDD